ncbi:MAG: hypothetical protein PHC75_01585 [Burkholderiales bacterium]|nr:hypothetical protein [Burkholderiales bacterium]
MKKFMLGILSIPILVSNSYADEKSELNFIEKLSTAINDKININNSTSFAKFNNAMPNHMMIEANTQGICQIRHLLSNKQYKDFIDAIFQYRTANCGEYAILSGVMLKGSGEFQNVLGMSFGYDGDHAFVIALGKSQNYYLFDAWTGQYGKIEGENALTRLSEEQDTTKSCPINLITHRPLCIYPETLFGTKPIPNNPYVSENSHSIYDESTTNLINFIYSKDGYNYIANKLFY